MTCRTLDIAHFIGKKWTVVILEEIALGKFNGFNSFLKRSGLTPRILSGQLREMEELGLIEGGLKKKSSYSLTKRGQEFRRLIKSIKSFSKKWNNIGSSCRNISCLECPEFKK